MGRKEDLLGVLMISAWGRYIVWGLFVVALFNSGLRGWGEPLWVQPEGRAWISVVASSLILIAVALALVNWLRGTRVPDDPLSLCAIFGEPVYAPCAGEVVAVENGLPDLTPPDSDSTAHLIECAEEGILSKKDEA